MGTRQTNIEYQVLGSRSSVLTVCVHRTYYEYFATERQMTGSMTNSLSISLTNLPHTSSFHPCTSLLEGNAPQHAEILLPPCNGRSVVIPGAFSPTFCRLPNYDQKHRDASCVYYTAWLPVCMAASRVMQPLPHFDTTACSAVHFAASDGGSRLVRREDQHNRDKWLTVVFRP